MTEKVAPLPTLRHLAHLTDALGIFEHAKLDHPRPECGYCTDDAGRLLAIASRLASDANAPLLAEIALGFLERAHVGGGIFHLRQGVDGSWTDDRTSDDANGRALLGLGTAVARAPWTNLRDRALVLFAEAAAFRSGHPRAIAYAALGAAELLQALPTHAAARHLVSDAADTLPSRGTDDAWPWPEPRLSYANALLPDAALAVATAMGNRGAANDALQLLEWLVYKEMFDGHFSFTPVGGRGPDGPQPAFDQQPIEAWAMSEACARAFAYTGDRQWADAARRSGAWFLGDNDVIVTVFDRASGGGFDGLEPEGVNRNEGAESTMAFVGTMLQLQELPSANAVASGHLQRSPRVGEFRVATRRASSR
ncbi:MAG: glycosyltransferase [Acidimicrobiales bacterium]